MDGGTLVVGWICSVVAFVVMAWECLLMMMVVVVVLCVVEDSEKRSRRRAFLRSSMLSRSSSSSSRVRLLRSAACNALVLSCARSCCSLASRDCNDWSGSSDCDRCNVCCGDLCKCSCRFSRCRC